MGQAPLRDEAGEPGEQAEIPRDRRRLRARGRQRGRVAVRTRLPRQLFLLPGLAAPRALDRRAGRHQRGEELPERRRQRLAPLLRHGEGRRLPRPRGERLPARAGQREHHRPVRRAGRAVRARIRRPPREPFVRRRPGLAHLLRARPDGPATAPRRVPGAREGDRPRRREDVRPARDARPRGGGRPGARHHHARPRDRRGGRARRRRRGARARADTATSSISRRTRRDATSRRRTARYKKGAAFGNPCFTQIHPTCIPVAGEHQSKLTLMSESLRNDGRVWVPKTEGGLRPEAG